MVAVAAGEAEALAEVPVPEWVVVQAEDALMLEAGEGTTAVRAVTTTAVLEVAADLAFKGAQAGDKIGAVAAVADVADVEEKSANV